MASLDVRRGRGDDRHRPERVHLAAAPFARNEIGLGLAAVSMLRLERRLPAAARLTPRPRG